jgi:2-methylaconitate cis-trans-isomerase PrpF
MKKRILNVLRGSYRVYTTIKMQSSVPAAYYRGGTSRALLFRESDLPASAASRRALFLQAIGAPDPHGRQLNGMGAGVSSLSKICFVGLPPNISTDGPQVSTQTASDVAEDSYDVTYTFVGVGIERDETDYAGNCGNMSSAIGPFAYNARLLASSDPNFYNHSGPLTVRILNTNTNKLIRNTFTVSNGQAQVDSNTHIDGVSGLGTGVMLDFVRPSGSKTSGLLPTGKVKQMLAGYEASCVDASNPCVFVRAKDIGIDPTVLPAVLTEMHDIRMTLERIRTAGAVAMGICSEGIEPPRVIPKIALVSPSTKQMTLSGSVNEATELDIVVRFISDAQPHRAIPLTGSLCTAAAAMVPGSIVNEALGKRTGAGSEGSITIGHPSGKIQVGAKMDGNGDVECVSVVRTARRIFEGNVFWNEEIRSEANR